jgi:serine/threonine-protein kinase
LTANTCVGNNTIAALLAGAADAEAAQRLEAHLDTCPACRQLVADLGRGLTAVGAGPTQEGSGGDGGGRLPRVGERLGRYDVRRIVGVGGMGVVYEAHDSALDRRVAIKLLRPDIVPVDAGAPQLLVEAKAMAKLQHPNIAVLHDVGLFEGQVYLCMEYVAGTTLRAWCAERTRSWREILAVFAAAGRGLAFVHRSGLVHLDFKPDNVLVCGSERVVVTDFGLARMVGGQRHTHGPRVALGTPAYMAPEQRRGQRTDARSDQFGFCAALQEALRGVDAPGWLRRTVTRGLSPSPADRFPSMEDLLAAFDAGLRRPRRRLMVAVGTALAATVFMLAARATTTVTRIIERPVTHTVFAPGLFQASAAQATSPSAFEASTAEPEALAAPTGAAGEGASGTTALERPTLAAAGAPTAQGGLAPIRALIQARASAVARGEAERAGESSPAGSGDGRCGDGSERSCPIPEPACPSGTIVAVRDGCWTCADAGTCAPLGLPLTCNDGSRLSCKDAAPTCPARQVAAVRNGCWSCQDAFACHSWSWAVPKKTRRSSSAKAAPLAAALQEEPVGEGTGSGGSSGSELTVASEAILCGNGFCDEGESNASCAADCCETTASGACVSSCGNGFCEAGEDHGSCAVDCCESSESGACL